MVKQKGAALIVVLSLLTISLMVGLSSMQSSQIDERLAGNYRAQSEVQMAAEVASSHAFGLLLGGLSGDIFVEYSPPETISWAHIGSINFDSVPDADKSPDCPANTQCAFRYVSVNSPGNSYGVSPGDYILTKGAISVDGGVVAESEPIFVNVSLSGFGWLSTVMAPDVLNVFNPPASEAEFVGGVVPAFAVSSSADKNLVENSGANIDGYVRAGFPEDSMFSNPNDADRFVDFINALSSVSDYVEGPVTSNNQSYGSVGSEKVTYINGDVSGNNVSGAGIMIINGDFKSNGNPSFKGLVIVLGDYVPGSGGGGDNLEGSLLVAPYVSNSDSDDIDYKFRSADIVFGGGGSNDFVYNKTFLDKAFEIMPDSAKEMWGSGNDSGASKWTVKSWK